MLTGAFIFLNIKTNSIKKQKKLSQPMTKTSENEILGKKTENGISFRND